MKLLLLVLGAALLMGADARCANDCSGHGTCGAFDMCTCYQNWQSADCSERTCQFGLAFIDTPQGDLNGDRVVSKGVESSTTSPSVPWANGKQFEYWPATDGEWSAVADEAHFYRECSNKGVCDRKAGNCKCYDGYEGIACERTVCPNACSGHGTCESISEVSSAAYVLWDQDKTMVCKCDPEYSGPDCSARECPMGDDPLTTTGVDEVQTITLGASADDLTGTFKLVFTDQFGETWTTSAITATKHSTSETLASTDTAAALKAIPNSRIENVVVTQATGTNGVILSITFTGNSGDIPQVTCVTTGFTHAGTVSTLAGDTPTCVAATTTGGTKEETTCSGRGLCDYSSGLCKCFKGYTLDDCSSQSALAY